MLKFCVPKKTAMGDNSNNKNNSELERRIVALETGSQYEANQSAVEQVRMECLQTLKQIRTALVMDQQQQQSNGMGVVASSLSTLNEQVLQQQQWEDEKTILQAKVSKLEYRIHHMVNSMETLYVKSK